MATEQGGQRIGERIGNYRLVRLLGSGGFADVYLGEHLQLGTHAAIKVLHTKLTNEQLEQFRQEARILAHLQHPHIVSVLDFDVQNMLPFLVMAYAPGGTLRQRHPKGSRVPLATIVEYVQQVASALDYAHSQKLIHRDIKPENMLIDQQGRIVLSDFGVASIAHNTTSQTLAAFAGTVAYIAPEQIQGRPRTASDQYALAVVIYEWLSGERPFQGSVTEIMSQHLMTPPRSFSEHIPGVTPAVEQVIFTALAKDPRERYASVGDFATALAQASLGSTASTVDEDTSPLPAVLEQRPVSTNEGGKAEAMGTVSMRRSDPTAPFLHPSYPASPMTPPSPSSAVAPSQPFAAGAAMNQSIPPVWAQSTQQPPRRQFPFVVVSVLLVVLLVTGGIVAAFSYFSGTNETAKISATSASSGRIVQTATSNTTKHTQDDRHATATAQAQVANNIAATASAGPDQLYNTVTSVKPTWSDSLSSQDSNNWTVSAHCSFSGGAYYITSMTTKKVESCYAPNTYFCNMALQVQITDYSGEGGGIDFRSAPNNYAYGFHLRPNGAYSLLASGIVNVIPYTLSSLPAFHSGYNVSNVITIIARGSNFYFYVNGQFLISANDSSLTCGKIGLFAVDWTNGPGAASFSNIKVWKL
jgi:serine/threonine protein kinase